MIGKIKLRQVKCSICFKEKYEYYPMQSVLQSFISFLYPLSSIQLLVMNYQKKNITNKKSKIIKDQYININNTLISPCKCLKAIHHQCLINQCLFLLSFKCPECDCLYSIDFKPKKIKIMKCVIIPSLIIVILLVSGLIFIIKLILPEKYQFWNYIIGIILLLFALGISIMLIISQHKLKLHYKAILSPYVDNDTNTPKKEYYDKMKEYCLNNYQMDYMELIEQKINLNTAMKLFKEYNVNDFVKQQNTFNKYDNNEDEEHDDLLKKKFKDHQIIKSSFDINPENLVKDKNKDYLSKNKSPRAQDSPYNIKLKSLSRTPLLMIKEAKEIIEDFSPVHSLDSKKKITMNFLIGYSKNNKGKFQMQTIVDKPKDEMLTLSNN